MNTRKPLYDFTYEGGFDSSLQPLDPRLVGKLCDGSFNIINIDNGRNVPYGGFAAKAADTGSRILTPLGNTWGGIKDIGNLNATGSVFQDIGASIWGIGSGQPHKEGADFARLQLSSLLKVLIAVNGSYDSPDSGAFIAGLPQPSAPDVAVLSAPGIGFTGLIDGAVSFKAARIRLSTGARSIASNTSAVIVPAKATVRVTFPLPSVGQTYWHLFATQQGFGGVGIHYQLAVDGSVDISEATVAASTVDGIPRSLEIDYRDGDLLPIEAYIDDYPPPAGTQAARVESSMVVFGCYSDSTSAPTGTDPGTCAAVSLPNYPESYKPRHILFFPEPVVTVLSRLIDSFCYVMCRNSIHAVQFVGWRNDLPSCTITTVSPEIGIVHPQNVTQAYGRLFFWNERSGMVAMNADGSLDYEFGAKIRRYTQDWDNTTTVGFDLLTRSVTVSNGNIMFSFCLQSGNWSTPIHLSDMIEGTIEASVTTRGEQIVSITDGSTHVAHSANQGGTSLPVMFCSNFTECTTKKGKNVYELLTSGEFTVAGKLFVALHSNFRKRVVRDAVVQNGNVLVTSASAQFTPNDNNHECFLFAPGIGGASGDYLAAQITYVNSTQVTIANLDGSPLTPSASSNNATMVIANQVFISDVDGTGNQDLYSWYPEVSEARQLSASAYFETNSKDGNLFSVLVSGNISEQSEIGI